MILKFPSGLRSHRAFQETGPWIEEKEGSLTGDVTSEIAEDDWERGWENIVLRETETDRWLTFRFTHTDRNEKA